MSITKKFQRNASTLLRELRADPWHEVLNTFSHLPEDELVNLFRCFLGIHGSMLDPFIVTSRKETEYGFALCFGLAIGTEWDVYVQFHSNPNDMLVMSARNNGEVMVRVTEDKVTLSDVLFGIEKELKECVKRHVARNIRNAVDVIKLASIFDLATQIAPTDLDQLIRFFARAARRKRAISEKRVIKKKVTAELAASASADVSAALATSKQKKPKPAMKLRGFKWHEAKTIENVDAQGFLLMEQQDKSWLVTYNNHAPVRAWDENAAKELVQDIVKDPNRLREFTTIPNMLKEGTIIRFQN